MFIVVCIGNLHYESGKLSVKRLTWVLPYLTGALFKWTSHECHFWVHTLLSSWAPKFHDSVSWPFPLFHDFKFSCHLWKLSKLSFFRGILGQKKSVKDKQMRDEIGAKLLSHAKSFVSFSHMQWWMHYINSMTFQAWKTKSVQTLYSG